MIFVGSTIFYLKSNILLRNDSKNARRGMTQQHYLMLDLAQGAERLKEVDAPDNFQMELGWTRGFRFGWRHRGKTTM